MQWEQFPELEFVFLLLTQGCPAAPAPVSVQAILLLCLLLGYAFLLIPLIDDLLKSYMGRKRKHSQDLHRQDSSILASHKYESTMGPQTQANS